ncbi:MAG: prolyl oligopeptidase family serine peptidase [Ilumatobacteraceae bacterium]
MRAVAAERCIGGSDLTEPRLSPDGRTLVYASSFGGAASLVVHHFDGTPSTRLAAAPALRPGRALGGGTWTFTSDGAFVVYVGQDGNLWQQPVVGDHATPLTNHGPDRLVSSPCVAPDGSGVVYVLDLEEVRWRSTVTGHNHRVDDGRADFCMDPFIDADSLTVRWHAWNVPDMPWDRSRVQVAGHRVAVHDEVAGAFAVQQPRSLPDGRPIWVRDDNGWLNIWVGEQPLVDEPYEHAGPSWGPGQRSYAWSPDGRHVAFTRNEAGFGRLCVVAVATGEVREVARGVHGQLSWQGRRLACLRTGARTPTQVVVYDTHTWERTVIAVGPSCEWEASDLIEPELLEVPVADGVVHARHYRAPDAGGRMIVWLHGGPTDQWQVTFLPRLAFWLSRGWSILVPDHRGSTGHGRAYQQALRGRWGELDVADTLAVVSHARAAGWAQPSRTVIIGASGGGLTALEAVAAQPADFAAAVLLYPVSDLAELAESSHRFERHYTHGLVGPLPATLEVYQRRSPAFHADRYAQTPLLVLHGENDAVVPVRQSQVFAQRVLTAGGRVELHVYPGEGHGFRLVENQLDEYRRIEDFLARYVPVASRS